MDTLDTSSLQKELVRRGHVHRDDTVEFEPLSGGVSSDAICLKVTSVYQSIGCVSLNETTKETTRYFVMKRALPKLRVEQEWVAGTERNLIESNCLQHLNTTFPDFVPRILFRDESKQMFVMDYIHGATWKGELLQGNVSTSVAKRLGEFLGNLHLHTFQKQDWIELLPSKHFFTQLRISPYFAPLMTLYPSQRHHIQRVIDTLMNTNDVLVHGDFSPKNIILRRPYRATQEQRNYDIQPHVIDWEVAHVGHPAFDVAFMLHHLFLKAIYLNTKAELYTQAGAVFYHSYHESVQVFEETTMRHITLQLIGALMLARIDGKSPVEYLTSFQRGVARKIGFKLLNGDIHDFPELYQVLQP